MSKTRMAIEILEQPEALRRTLDELLPARDQVAEIAKQLLSNPVIEDFRILETHGSTEQT